MSDITRRGFIGAGATAAMAAALAGCTSDSRSAAGASASASTASTPAASGGGAETMTLVLLRHGESEWNKANLFTGWTDAHLQPAYRDVEPADIPMCECLKDTVARTWPYFESEILPQMKAGKRVLIAAHGNSLRSLVMQFDKLSEDEVVELNIPTGIPLVYEFDQNMNVLEKRHIGDPAVIEAKVNQVASQGKAK